MKRTEKTDKILAKYKQYLKLEKSLSTNTVEAYLTDLDKLMAYLTLENLHPLEVTLEHLETFSAGLRDIGIHPRSQARILSGIRSFYHFLVLENYLEIDPTELLGGRRRLTERASAEICGDIARSAHRGRDRPSHREYRQKHQRRTTKPSHPRDTLQLRASRIRTMQPEIIRPVLK